MCIGRAYSAFSQLPCAARLLRLWVWQLCQQQAEPNPSQVGVVSGVTLLLLAVMFLQVEELPLITLMDMCYVFPNTLQFPAKGSPGW